MKKLLALVLALVMTLSLCTVTNAAFPDAADVDYKEAVDVMSAVGVFKGDEKGNFNPDANLTRETAAKLIAYLDLGEKVAEALPAVKVFSDVEANRWSAKYIAYCADAGYIAGIGDGSFNPTGELTGYAFGKLLLCVLGYDANIEGYTGASWSINVAKAMQNIDLADGVDKAGSAVLTREEAAQYCLNALKADMVDYENKGTNVTINGAVIATGASKAAAVKSKAAFAQTIDAVTDTDGFSVVQLGEKLYNGDLKIVAATSADDFGRPANEWKYKTESVGTYGTAEPVATYTAAVKGGTIYTDLGKVTLTDSNIKAVKVNGYDESNAWLKNHVKSGDTDKIGGNGTVIEVYKDSADKYTFVAVQTFVAEVTGFTAAKLDANGDVIEGKEAKITLKAYNNASNSWVSGLTFETEDFTKQDATDGTVILVTATYDGSDYTVQSAVAAKKVEDVTVTGYKADTNVTADGTTYKYNENAYGADTAYDMKDSTYTLFFDENGYVVYVDTYAEAASTDYLYVVDKTADKQDDFSTDKYNNYKVLDMNGKVSTVKAYTANGADKNDIVTMKDDTKHDGFVKFTAVPEATDGTLTSNKLDKTQPTIASGIAANAKTVFVLKEGTADSNSWKVYTGIANVPGYKNATSVNAYAVVKDSYAKVVFIDLVDVDASSSSADELIYLFKNSSTTKAVVNGEECYVYDAVVDGEKTTINAAAGSLAAAGLVKITEYDADGFVKTVAAVSGDKYAVTSVTNKKVTYSEPTLTIDGVAVALTNNATVYMIDSDDDLTVSTASALVSDHVTGTFSIVHVSDKDATVAAIYFDGTID